MTEIISVRFKTSGKAYYFNPNGLQVSPGDDVVIETSRGTEFGECVEGNRLIDERELVSPLRPVLRRATPEDRATLERNRAREEEAFAVCQEKIRAHGLDMKLVRVEYSFDGSKILFFFTADGRVDFRALVRDLASVFHTRIELRQIGVRDEAKMLGGLGICGRPYCCSAFLDDFHSVSIKMAKTQNLSLNPAKISGACGRLMCCLKYEQEAYEDVLSRTPRLASLVETPDGVGTVNSVQLLREKVKVKLDSDPESPRVYDSEDIRVLRSGKGKRPTESRKPSDPAEDAAEPQPADAAGKSAQPKTQKEAAPKSGKKTKSAAVPETDGKSHPTAAAGTGKKAKSTAGAGTGEKSGPTGHTRNRGEKPHAAATEKPAGEDPAGVPHANRRPPRKREKGTADPEKNGGGPA